MSANTKDRCPKMRGSARAYMLLERHLLMTDIVLPDGSRGFPMVHQSDGLACMMERLERFGSFGLLHDMGCGKTLTMLGMLLGKHEEGSADSMLVICPSSVIAAWQREGEALNRRHAARGNDPVVEVLGLSMQGVPKREAALRRCLLDRDQRRASGDPVPPLVVAINYESVWRGTMEGTLRASHFDIVACDESQKVKAAGSEQSKAMYRIGKHMRALGSGLAPLRVIMSGTPVPEGGLDWYGQWRFADPELFGTNHSNFKAKFALEIPCTSSDGKNFRKYIVNPHNKSELERVVMERCHRVSKEEAVDLPEKMPAVIEFDMTPRQRRIYDDLVKDSIALIERRSLPVSGGDEFGEVVGDNVLTRMLRLQQITGGYVQVDGADSVEPADPKSNPKLRALEDLAEALRDTGKKLVVFHRFTHEGLAIEKMLTRLGGKNRPLAVINGSINGPSRKQALDDFQEGDALFFVGQIQACAEGITLHAASDSALYSMPFASGIYLQALDRIHRIGQVHNVTNHHLIATRSIDGTVYDAQRRKRDASADTVDGGWQRFFTGG